MMSPSKSPNSVNRKNVAAILKDDRNAKKALELKAQIEKTDKEIDQMVYALYELTEDEIRIVEAS